MNHINAAAVEKDSAEPLVEFSRPMKISAVVIICAFGAVLACSLGVTDIQSTHEGRVADVARNMLGGEGYWVPVINAVPRLEKSPLVYWVVAGSGKIWGGLDEFSARLPSVIIGLGGVVITILIGRSLFNSTVGLIAGLVQISLFVYWRECRTAELDLYLTFFMSAAMLAYCRWLFKRPKANWFWVVLFWVSMGCGAASKTILAVLPGLAACGLGLLLCKNKTDEQAKTGRRWLWQVIGIGLFLLIGLSWNVSMLARSPELTQGLWDREIHAVLLHADSFRPMSFYLSRIFLWAFPVSAFVPASLLVILSPRLKQYRKEMLLMLLWVVAVVGAYSMWPWGKKKLEYILPMISAFSVLAGLLWNELLSKQKQRQLNAGDRITLTAHNLLLLIVGLAAVGFAIIDAQGRWMIAVVGAGLIGLSIVSAVVKSGRTAILLWGTVLGSLGAMVVNFVWVQPVINEQMSPRIFAEAVARYGGKAGKVVLYSPGFRRASAADRKEQGIPPLNFYLKYNVAYMNSVEELEEFRDDHPEGLIIALQEYLTEEELKELDIKVLHRQNIHRVHLELTSERLPKSWQERIDEWLAEYAQGKMRYTLLLGK